MVAEGQKQKVHVSTMEPTPLLSVSKIMSFPARFVLEERRNFPMEGTTTVFSLVNFQVKLVRYICIEK